MDQCFDSNKRQAKGEKGKTTLRCMRFLDLMLQRIFSLHFASFCPMFELRHLFVAVYCHEVLWAGVQCGVIRLFDWSYSCTWCYTKLFPQWALILHDNSVPHMMLRYFFSNKTRQWWSKIKHFGGVSLMPNTCRKNPCEGYLIFPSTTLLNKA